MDTLSRYQEKFINHVDALELRVIGQPVGAKSYLPHIFPDKVRSIPPPINILKA